MHSGLGSLLGEVIGFGVQAFNASVELGEISEVTPVGELAVEKSPQVVAGVLPDFDGVVEFAQAGL